jgi:AcrR family transcriptional regulator
MKRDAQATRQRILEAATTEFAQYGIAGARVDRIAEVAGCNKAMIYAYYTSKDQLFDAVFGTLIVRSTRDVPIDAHDLPEYAACLFDLYQTYPEILRISTWDRLERGGEGMKTKAVVEAIEHKVSEIHKAQQNGIVSRHFPAATLLELILTLTQTQLHRDGLESKNALKKHRIAIKDAVRKLIREEM